MHWYCRTVKKILWKRVLQLYCSLICQIFGISWCQSHTYLVSIILYFWFYRTIFFLYYKIYCIYFFVSKQKILHKHNKQSKMNKRKLFNPLMANRTKNMKCMKFSITIEKYLKLIETQKFINICWSIEK